jgi:hypothetical protein
MDKQGTIEKMLEAIYILKVEGMRGAGIDAIYELKEICEKLLAIHAAQKRTPGCCINGDKAPISLVSDHPENEK